MHHVLLGEELSRLKAYCNLSAMYLVCRPRQYLLCLNSKLKSRVILYQILIVLISQRKLIWPFQIFVEEQFLILRTKSYGQECFISWFTTL